MIGLNTLKGRETKVGFRVEGKRNQNSVCFKYKARFRPEINQTKPDKNKPYSQIDWLIIKKLGTLYKL